MKTRKLSIFLSVDESDQSNVYSHGIRVGRWLNTYWAAARISRELRTFVSFPFQIVIGR